MPIQSYRRALTQCPKRRPRQSARRQAATRHRPLFCEALEMRTLLAADVGLSWQNPHDPLDVDHNCMVNQSDADRLRQKLAADGATPLPTTGPVDYYWNVKRWRRGHFTEQSRMSPLPSRLAV